MQGIQGYTRVYKELHGCTRVIEGFTWDYRGIKGLLRWVYKSIQGITGVYRRVYKGLQGFSKDNRRLQRHARLQWITGVFKVLQRITRVYKGLLGITRDYKGLMVFNYWGSHRNIGVYKMTARVQKDLQGITRVYSGLQGYGFQGVITQAAQV